MKNIDLLRKMIVNCTFFGGTFNFFTLYDILFGLENGDPSTKVGQEEMMIKILTYHNSLCEDEYDHLILGQQGTASSIGEYHTNDNYCNGVYCLIGYIDGTNFYEKGSCYIGQWFLAKLNYESNRANLNGQRVNTGYTAFNTELPDGRRFIFKELMVM